MSEAGQQPPAQVPASPIDSPVWRDRVAIFNNCARPATIYLGGIGALLAVVIAPSWETAGICASMATGLGYFSHKDKAAALEAAK